jgi:aspartate/methionine/tyrosine aminotransferase
LKCFCRSSHDRMRCRSLVIEVSFLFDPAKTGEFFFGLEFEKNHEEKTSSHLSEEATMRIERRSSSTSSSYYPRKPNRRCLQILLTSTMLLRSASSLVRPSFLHSSIKRSSVALSTAASSSTPSSSTSTPSTTFALSDRLEGLDKPTVWHEFSPLAVEHGAMNLGQGFPDWDPPLFVRESMQSAVDPSVGRNANQYARSYAHLPLAQVLAEDYTERWNMMDTPINPATQVATAVGCTNALYCALHGILSRDDEVILLEPAFDIYSSQVRMAGAKPVFVPLRPTGKASEGASKMFTLDLDELEAAITDKTRVLLINTPHNPTGKMFSMQELQGIAAIVQRHPAVTIISDEVYEHIVFDPENEPHISMASLPGMFDRTLTLSSSGKTFSCTGWKVGWAIGPPHLVKAVSAVQQYVMNTQYSLLNVMFGRSAGTRHSTFLVLFSLKLQYLYLDGSTFRLRHPIRMRLHSLLSRPRNPTKGFLPIIPTSPRNTNASDNCSPTP